MFCSTESTRAVNVCVTYTGTSNTLEYRGEFKLEMSLSESARQLEFTEFAAFRERDRCVIYYVKGTVS